MIELINTDTILSQPGCQISGSDEGVKKYIFSANVVGEAKIEIHKNFRDNLEKRIILNFTVT